MSGHYQIPGSKTPSQIAKQVDWLLTGDHFMHQIAYDLETKVQLFICLELGYSCLFRNTLTTKTLLSLIKLLPTSLENSGFLARARTIKQRTNIWWRTNGYRISSLFLLFLLYVLTLFILFVTDKHLRYQQAESSLKEWSTGIRQNIEFSHEIIRSRYVLNSFFYLLTN